MVRYRPAFSAPKLREWNGIFLGTETSIKLYSDNNSLKLFSKVSDEILRLEKIFSLYQEKSEISLLNRNGFIEDPSEEILEVINFCNNLSVLTNGLYDITIQPLWELYSKSFADTNSPPTVQEIEKTSALIGYQNISIDDDYIKFNISGMKISLNSIAQGYITDKIVDLLVSLGVASALVDIGEKYALGKHPDGTKWLAGVAHPLNSKKIIKEIEIENQALATSSPYGTRFSKAHHHIFNPITGKSENLHKSVTVIAHKAIIADALSTALLLLENSKSSEILTHYNAYAFTLKT